MDGAACNLSWAQLRPTFQEIRYPDIGGEAAWDRWFDLAWLHISSLGLARCETVIDLARVRMRVFSLCWLAHDFCGATFGEFHGATPYWEDWLGEVKVSASLVLALASLYPGFDSIIEAMDEEHCGLGDVQMEEVEAELTSELAPRLPGLAAAFVAHMLRKEIVPALAAGFGNVMGLLASLWGATHITGDEDSADAELIEQSVFTDPITVDEQMGQRMCALEWIQAGCPVQAVGYPEYYPRQATRGRDHKAGDQY